MSDQQHASRYPLFAFGTLRRGHENHHYLVDRYVRAIRARLHGYHRVQELMIAPQDGEFVDGELFFLKEDDYDTTLAGCDELEEIPVGKLVGHEYQRKLVSVETSEGPIQAWAYVQPE